MPITIIQQPSKYSYSGNPITFEIEPSTVFTDGIVGTLMVLNLAFDLATADEANKIIFSTNFEKITFTFVNNYTATDAADTLPTKGNLDTEQWILAIVNALFSNSFFVKNYALKILQTTFIQLQAKKHTSNFTITTNVLNLDVTVHTQGVPPSVPANYEIVCDINSNFYGSNNVDVDTIAVIPSSTTPYYCYFMLEKILEARLKLQLPKFITTQKLETHHRRFYLNYAEKYGNPAVERATNVLEPVTVIMGSSDWFFLEQLRNANINFDLSDYLLSFKTLQLEYKKTDLDQPEFLVFYNKDYTGSLKLFVRVQWDTGSLTTHIIETIALQPNEMWCVAAGWEQLGIVHPNFPNKQPATWEVSLAVFAAFGFNGHQTNVQKYVNSYKCDATFLIFLNSQGGFDTVRLTTQRIKKGLKIEKETLKRIWRKDSFPATEIYRKSNTKTFKVETGIIERDYAEYMSELFEAKHVFEINKGIYIPIIISSDTVQIIDGGDDLYNVSFDYQHAINY
jgi:hypothetical protein